jgi:hypothetical protein
MTTENRSAGRRFIVVALVVPAIVVLSGAAVLLASWSSLPDPIALHWDLTGQPDGFGPPWVALVLLLVAGLGLPSLLAALIYPGIRTGDRGRATPFLAAFALALSVFLTVLVTVTTLRQAGLPTAAEADGAWLVAASALVLGALSGIVGWYVQPRRRFEPSRAAAAPAAPLAPSERAAWLQRVTLARTGVIVLGGAVLLLIAITAVTAVATTDVVALWIVAAATVLVGLAAFTTCVFHVRVDAAGLSVTSAAGWPRVHVPLDDVRETAIVDVDPMGQFGGWGLRWAPDGRFGVVLRTGPGIEVRRRSGKTFTVTVDDAATGAAMLNALVHCHESAARRPTA